MCNATMPERTYIHLGPHDVFPKFFSGGHTHDGNTNDVYQLDLKTWIWSLLNVPDPQRKMSPRDKHTAWLHDDKYSHFNETL